MTKTPHLLPISGFLFCIILCCTSALAGQQTLLRSWYHETTGKHQKTFQLTLHDSAELTLTYQDEDETCLTTYDSEFSTRHWRMESADRQTMIEATRLGNTLIVRGLLSGRPINRTHELGELPWFQALSVSLRTVINNPNQIHDFWILRPDTLDLHRMQVSEPIETVLEIQGKQIPTWQMTIRLAGWQSYLWHADYWLRRTDRRFVKYEGVSGPPGTPATVITLARDEPLAEQEGPVSHNASAP